MTPSIARDPSRASVHAAALLFLSLAATLTAAGCHRPATVIDACEPGQAQEEERCLACNGDEDCQFTGNACTETVYCAHEEVLLSVVAIGCDEAVEYSWPDASKCQCVASVCRYRE